MVLHSARLVIHSNLKFRWFFLSYNRVDWSTVFITKNLNLNQDVKSVYASCGLWEFDGYSMETATGFLILFECSKLQRWKVSAKLYRRGVPNNHSGQNLYSIHIFPPPVCVERLRCAEFFPSWGCFARRIDEKFLPNKNIDAFKNNNFGPKSLLNFQYSRKFRPIGCVSYQCRFFPGLNSHWLSCPIWVLKSRCGERLQQTFTIRGVPK